MQIKFLTIYGSPIHGVTALDAQYNLLGYWQNSLLNCQVLPLKKAEIDFTDYSFAEYPDQEKLCKEIKNSVSSSFNYEHNTTYWWLAGKRYGIFKELYDDLAVTHRLMELTITVEEE